MDTTQTDTVPTSKFDDDNNESEENYRIPLSALGVRVAARAYTTSVSFSLANISDLTRQEREKIEAEVNRANQPEATRSQKVLHLLSTVLNFFCTMVMHYMPYRVGKLVSGSR